MAGSATSKNPLSFWSLMRFRGRPFKELVVKMLLRLIKCTHSWQTLRIGPLSQLTQTGIIEAMIKPTQGNLLEAPAEALVNTVNTVGVMGKGIALMFKEAFPKNFLAYENACEHRQVKIGKMFVTESGTFS